MNLTKLIVYKKIESKDDKGVESEMNSLKALYSGQLIRAKMTGIWP